MMLKGHKQTTRLAAHSVGKWQPCIVVSFGPNACPTSPRLDLRLIGANSMNNISGEQQFSDYRRLTS
jgi:hypothetical protein